MGEKKPFRCMGMVMVENDKLLLDRITAGGCVGAQFRGKRDFLISPKVSYDGFLNSEEMGTLAHFRFAWERSDALRQCSPHCPSKSVALELLALFAVLKLWASASEGLPGSRCCRGRATG